VFGVIEQMGGKLLRTISQARTSFAMMMMAVCYNLKAAGLFQKGWNRGLLTPEMGRIVDTRGENGATLPGNTVIRQRN